MIQCGPWVKIGVSSDTEHRVKVLQRGCPLPLRVAHVWRFPDVRRPWVLERRLHSALKDLALHGEWFCASVHDVIVAAETVQPSLLEDVEIVTCPQVIPDLYMTYPQANVVSR